MRWWSLSAEWHSLTMDTADNTPHGKRGELRMHFERDNEGRSILREMYRRAPIIVQQALYFDENMPLLPCVYILSAGGPVVEGDNYSHHISLGNGACAHISTGAATKVAQMRGGWAQLKQHISLGEDAYLEWLPEMTIPCAGAQYKSVCEVEVAPSATLFYAECYTSGRRFFEERYRYRRLDLSIRIVRPNGESVFAERQLIEPSVEIESVGVMAGMDIFSSVVIIAPPHITLSLYSSIEPRLEKSIALGVHLLPHDEGIVCRIVGRATADVKSLTRELCSMLRQRVQGVALPEEFAWR